MRDKVFIKNYRLTKELARELITDLTPHLPPTLRSDALDVDTKVLAALEFYATGSYQTIVGNDRRHCISQASVSKAIKNVTLALNKPEILNKYVSFPFQLEEREQVKRQFYTKYRMRGLLACVDGTHVAIVTPTTHPERYKNRKGYYSLNIMIMCDSNLNILCVDASYPGSTHDSVVWANHYLNPYLDRLHRVEGEDVYLLGDSGYSLRPTMMIPLTNPNPGPEENYQNLHLSARSVVERCIGVLKARFRCLLVDRKLHYSPQVAARITNACCVLHNIAHRARVAYTPLTAEEAARERRMTEGASGRAPPAPQSREAARRALSELQLGRARRQQIIQRLSANANRRR
ncbi:hypothetical protein O0L34_g6216 [Tuta absoluta]|nr:hypothetical protein O0L34_g6216 [Tuta absoluta]